MLALISLEVVIVKIRLSAIVSCLPPLIIAIVASIAMPSFLIQKMKSHGETIQLPIGQLRDKLKLAEQQMDLQALSCKMESCREIVVNKSR